MKFRVLRILTTVMVSVIASSATISAAAGPSPLALLKAGYSTSLSMGTFRATSSWTASFDALVRGKVEWQHRQQAGYGSYVVGSKQFWKRPGSVVPRQDQHIRVRQRIWERIIRIGAIRVAARDQGLRGPNRSLNGKWFCGQHAARIYLLGSRGVPDFYADAIQLVPAVPQRSLAVTDLMGSDPFGLHASSLGNREFDGIPATLIRLTGAYRQQGSLAPNGRRGVSAISLGATYTIDRQTHEILRIVTSASLRFLGTPFKYKSSQRVTLRDYGASVSIHMPEPCR